MRKNIDVQRHAEADVVEFKHVTVRAYARHLTELRHELDAWLAAFGVSADSRFALVVAANEAAANAVEHAYPAAAIGTVELTCWMERGLANVEVSDHGQWHASGGGIGGRGISLMHECADAVHVEHDERGTRVLLQHAVPLADRPG